MPGSRRHNCYIYTRAYMVTAIGPLKERGGLSVVVPIFFATGWWERMQDSPLQKNTVSKQGGAKLAQGSQRMFKREAPCPSVLDDKSLQRNGRPILIFDMGPPPVNIHNYKAQSTLCILMQFIWPKLVWTQYAVLLQMGEFFFFNGLLTILPHKQQFYVTKPHGFLYLLIFIYCYVIDIYS